MRLKLIKRVEEESSDESLTHTEELQDVSPRSISLTATGLAAEKVMLPLRTEWCFSLD